MKNLFSNILNKKHKEINKKEKLELKVNEMKELMKFGDGSDQYLQGERNVTYVSRMQCL